MESALLALFVTALLAKTNSTLGKLKEIISSHSKVTHSYPSETSVPLGFSDSGKFAFYSQYGDECKKIGKSDKYAIETLAPVDPPELIPCTPSGIYKFTILDLINDKPVQLTANQKDVGNFPIELLKEDLDLNKASNVNKVFMIFK